MISKLARVATVGLIFTLSADAQEAPDPGVVAPDIDLVRRIPSRLELIRPRLPSESEDPEAMPSELPVTSTQFGYRDRVSLSRSTKNMMRLPDSFDRGCLLIAGDMVSLTYLNDDPNRPVIGSRATGGEWCNAPYPPGFYSGPCSVEQTNPVPPTGVVPFVTGTRTSKDTWFQDELGNRSSIGPSSCKPVHLDPGRYRIYIEKSVRITTTSPCETDVSIACSKSSSVATLYEGGIFIDANLPEASDVTDVAPLVPTWWGPESAVTGTRSAADPIVDTDRVNVVDPNVYNFVDLLGPVFTHDRCTTCHSYESPGGKLEFHVNNEYLTGWDPVRHYGLLGYGTYLSESISDTFHVCEDCHWPEMTQVNRGFRWETAMLLGYAGPWQGLSAREICEDDTMQRFIARGAAAVKEHLLNDPRIQWAIRVRWTPRAGVLGEDGMIDDSIVQPEFQDAPALTWPQFAHRGVITESGV